MKHTLVVIFIIFLTSVTIYGGNLTEYEEMLSNIERLEELAAEYQSIHTKTKADDLIFNFIRCERYSGMIWRIAAGAKNEDFEAYVTANQGKNYDLASLRELGILELPNGETTDFVHMAAVMNMQIHGYDTVGDIGGWLGDTVELVSDLIESGAKTTSVYILQLEASKLFLKSGRFDGNDWRADLDAYNICTIRNDNQDSPKTFAEIFAEYFETITEEKRVISFVSSRFEITKEDKNFTRSALRKKIWEIYNTPIVMLLEQSEQFGIHKDTHLRHRKAACNTVADYIYEVISNS